MNKEFEGVRFGEQGLESAKEITRLFDDLITALNGLCFDGREYAIAKTKLQEAHFFAQHGNKYNEVLVKQPQEQDNAVNEG